MLQSWIAKFGLISVLLVCLYAFFAGGWRERFGAAIYLIAYAVSIGFGLISTSYTTLYLLVADALCLQGFYVLSWKSPHPWPKWAMGAQLLCVAAEVATMFHIGIRSYALLTVEIAGAYAVLLSLLFGTIAAAGQRRQARQLSVPK